MPWFILLSLCIAIFSANSKAQEHPAEQLLNIEIAAYQLSSAFSAYVLFTGLPQHSQKLERVVNATNPIMTNAKARYPDIAKQLQESLNYIEEKKELVFSPDDHRLIIGFATYQNPLYQLIDQRKKTAAKDSSKSLDPLPAALEENLITRISFERVIAQYIAISASSAGFVVSDTSIEENVNIFSSRLENITNEIHDVKRVKMKWRFIKTNMLKKPGQTSPFITMRTAVDIRKILQRIYKSELVTDSEF